MILSMSISPCSGEEEREWVYMMGGGVRGVALFTFLRFLKNINNKTTAEKLCYLPRHLFWLRNTGVNGPYS